MANANNFVSIVNEFFSASLEKEPDSCGTIILEGAKCNMSCDYCFVDACSKEKDQIEFNEDTIRKVLKTAKNSAGPNSYITVWAGEPLYNKEAFIKICELINEELPEVQILINTNGILLDDWWAQFLIDHNVYVNLSHDGPGQKYRGPDYFEISSCVKAIHKLIEANHIKNIVTVIHKHNCEFDKIKQFFDRARAEKGITPRNYEFILVAPSISNEIIYDFDYMDQKLIKFVQDSIQYIASAMLKNEFFYTKMVSQVWSIIQGLCQKPSQSLIEWCNEYRNVKFSISTTGEHKCSRGFFNREHNKEIMEDHLNRCSRCDVKHACPMAKCAAINLSDELCLKLRNRLATFSKALDEILNIWNSYELG